MNKTKYLLIVGGFFTVILAIGLRQKLILPDDTESLQEDKIPQRKPNIVYVLIDDMGWKDLGCTGSTYYETPNIDKMASEGMIFLNAYSASSLCAPSRGAILSGKNPARTKFTTVFYGNAGPDDRLYEKSKYQGEQDQYLEALHRHVLPSSETLISEALSDGGYKTGLFGKWHVGECPGYFPDERGFDVAKGYRLTYSPPVHFLDQWPKGVLANMPEPKKDDYLSDILTDQCIEFIKENKEVPFFAFLSHHLVHAPYQPKAEIYERYKDKQTTDQVNPKYAAMVESVDESMGRLLNTLKDLGLEKNTLVIFTSDNGGYVPDATSNYPVFGGKAQAFEGGVRVPLIMKWPGVIETGESSDRVIGMDFYPTLLSAAGLPLRPEQHMDGMDITPLFKKENLPERPLVFHYPHYTGKTGPYSSIIDNDWKLIQFYNDETGAYLLYNLAEDPDEQNDLAESQPEIRDRLAQQLKEMLVDMGAEFPILNENDDPNREGTLVQGKWTEGRVDLKWCKEVADIDREIIEKRLK